MRGQIARTILKVFLSGCAARSYGGEIFGVILGVGEVLRIYKGEQPEDRPPRRGENEFVLYLLVCLFTIQSL